MISWPPEGYTGWQPMGWKEGWGARERQRWKHKNTTVTTRWHPRTTTDSKLEDQSLQGMAELKAPKQAARRPPCFMAGMTRDPVKKPIKQQKVFRRLKDCYYGEAVPPEPARALWVGGVTHRIESLVTESQDEYIAESLNRMKYCTEGWVKDPTTGRVTIDTHRERRTGTGRHLHSHYQNFVSMKSFVNRTTHELRARDDKIKEKM